MRKISSEVQETSFHLSTDFLGDPDKEGEEQNEDNEDHKEQHLDPEQENASKIGEENYLIDPISFMKQFH